MLTVDHYYSSHPSIKSDRHMITFDLRGHQLSFVADSGVFSKNTIDYGSRVLIDAIPSEWLNQETKLLDVGCGYGPIGIALAKEANCYLDSVDVNERAVELTQLNRVENGVVNGETFLSDGYSNITTRDYSFIVTNPPIRAGKKTVHRIISEAKEHLKPGGHVVCVIQKKQGAPSAKKMMAEQFGNVIELTRDKGYWILASTLEEV